MPETTAIVRKTQDAWLEGDRGVDSTRHILSQLLKPFPDGTKVKVIVEKANA